MKSAELLKPRFKVIADYPKSVFKVGETLHGDLIYCDTNGPKYSDYPHLFRKLNWWEERKKEDMPKKLISRLNKDSEVFEILSWDMNRMLGFTDEAKRECCDLILYKPEYGYFPID